MNQAKEQYDQASGRYRVGLGDAIELKDAETTYMPLHGRVDKEDVPRAHNETLSSPQIEGNTDGPRGHHAE